MKRIWMGLLLLALLAGCGTSGESPETQTPEEDHDRSLAEPAEPDPEGRYLTMEREVYDPSLTTFTYFVINHTEEAMEFGEDYRIQRLCEDVWLDLTPRENRAFTGIGYSLEPGGEMALTCTLDMYEEFPEPGRYRLVKDLSSGGTAAAEFTLGNSPYTAKTPYGFIPLEELPEIFGADTAEENCVVFSSKGAANLEAAEEFLRKAALRASCQLRVAQDCGEGGTTVTDVLYENGRFLWRLWSGGTITEQYFSCIVTDGQDLYLSNGADWSSGEKYGDRRTLLIPGGVTPEMISTVGNMTGVRLKQNAARYQVWSADGIWSVGLTDTPTEFCVSRQRPGEGSRGSVYDLQDWDGLETAITAVSWQEDGTLLLTCETSEGGASKLAFDPETERLTSLELCGLPLAEES